MSYTIRKEIQGDFTKTAERVRQALSEQGFGILNEIDFQATLKKKLDQDIPAYLILGACHPQSAFESFQAEAQIGVVLPCNVIVRDLENGSIEVAAINPHAMMEPINNESLTQIAGRVGQLFEKAIASL